MGRGDEVRKEIKLGIKSGGLCPDLDSVTRSCGTEERKWTLESLPPFLPETCTLAHCVPGLALGVGRQGSDQILLLQDS